MQLTAEKLRELNADIIARQSGWNDKHQQITATTKRYEDEVRGYRNVADSLLEDTQKLILKAFGGWPTSFAHQVIMTWGFDERYQPLMALNQKILANQGKLMVIYAEEESETKDTLLQTSVTPHYFIARINGELYIPDQREVKVEIPNLALFPYDFLHPSTKKLINGKDFNNPLFPWKDIADSVVGVPDANKVEILVDESEITSETDYLLKKNMTDLIADFLEAEQAPSALSDC